MTQFNFEAIGTHWQIDIYRELSRSEQEKVLLAVKDRIEFFDKTYSRFRADSLVTRMSHESGIFRLPDDAEPMLKLYRDLYLRTDGLVTPLVGDMLSDAGYDAQYSLTQKKQLQVAPDWANVIEYIPPNITIKKPAILDFGAAGKGYLVDLVGAVLETRGILEYCINAGGDILHKGVAPIRIGLENPDNVSQVIGVYTLGSGSICGSAGNRRTWGDFTHVINPRTLISPKHILAVWVVAETAIVADGLATCLFFVPAQTLLGAYTFEYLIVRSDHTFERSKLFSGEIFSE